jgi:hypothetical protein
MGWSSSLINSSFLINIFELGSQPCNRAPWAQETIKIDNSNPQQNQRMKTPKIPDSQCHFGSLKRTHEPVNEENNKA